MLIEAGAGAWRPSSASAIELLCPARLLRRGGNNSVEIPTIPYAYWVTLQCVYASLKDSLNKMALAKVVPFAVEQVSVQCSL